ncbi:MAG TPA: outer membrane lipid asymmetry maintenance protein MlaD [Gammaproteobacteria bacterium]|jgi:phospholipid/cholesterol/gamma-HCH transport system substrate-binding protein|nr:outer membrane lipid asymmetry maintenance protein MlaD [Gammaproteobacteria bacterium]
MKQTRAVEFGTGLFILFGILALFFLATQTTNFSYVAPDTYSVTAVFQNIGGLKVRAPVSMSGVKIGRVAAIELDPRRLEAVVTIDIDKKYNKLPRDTVASILTAGLLGEQYVGLNPGGSEKYLRNGDRIQFTQSAIILEHLIGQFLAGQSNKSPEQP